MANKKTAAEEIEDARAVIRELHESTQDYKNVIREFREERERCVKIFAELEKQQEERIQEKAEAVLWEFMEQFEKFNAQATQQVFDKFDGLARIMLGEEKDDHPTIAFLLRDEVKKNGPYEGIREFFKGKENDDE